MGADYYIDVRETEAESKKQEILKAFGLPKAPTAPGEKYARFSLIIERGLPKTEGLWDDCG